MNLNSISVPSHARAGVIAAAVASTLLLASCAVEFDTGEALSGDGALHGEGAQEADAASNDDVGAAGTTTISMAGESFSFTNTLCMIQEDGILLEGPGVGNESDEPAFLSIDFVTEPGVTTGSVRIELGTDRPFDSSDDFFSAVIGGADEYSIEYGDDSFVVEGIFRMRGEASLGPGTVTADCG